MRLVVTRPVEDAGRQADTLAALGHVPLIHPLMKIVYASLAPIQLTGVQALIATSRNALRGLERNPSWRAAKCLPLVSVGENTGEFAREAGFGQVISGPGTARELVPVITSAFRPGDGALLYLTGEHIAFDLERPLAAAGFAVPRLILYESQEVDEDGATAFAQAIRAGVNGVILMSPRTAGIFVRLVKRFELEGEVRAITCYCYSNAIAEALSEIEGLTIAAASRPTEDELIGLIGAAPFRSPALADLRDALGKH
jgi:uroporphyrinogen-III synthase